MSVETDYELGRCRDCGTKIQSLGSSSRCGSCDEKFSVYVDSGWGLDQVAAERGRNQLLGLCFYCGSGLDDPIERMCNECQLRTENGSWSRAMHRNGRQASADRNPYMNVWDSNDVDHAVHLDATYGTVAEQMLTKARYYKRMAERGGPRGREALEEARIFIRVAAKLLEREKLVRKRSR